MIKNLILILFLTTSFLCFSQERTVRVKTQKEWAFMVRKYHVLASDKQTKHGKYKEYRVHPYLTVMGYYKMDKKVGVWYEYYDATIFNRKKKLKSITNYKNGLKEGDYILYSKSGIVLSKGKYENDKKIGIWEEYDDRGILFEKIDYSTNTPIVVNYQKIDSSSINIVKPSIHPDESITKPIYNDGDFVNYLKNQIIENIKIDINKELNLQYKFTVLTTGEIIDIDITTNKIYESNISKIREFIKYTSGKWESAETMDGRKIDYEFSNQILIMKN